MPDYRELPPPPHLAAAVECFWSMRGRPRGPGGEWVHRVTPDGCADILFDGRGLQLVGAMTAWRDFPFPDGQQLFGMRFRPGMWSGPIGAPAAAITDRILPLDCLWGSRAARLADRVAEAPSDAHAAEILAGAIPAPAASDPIARALAWMERRRGIVSMDELAGHAGLSPRQLRRVTLERTGLPPKFLARILRFRHAQERLAAGRRGVPSSFAALALDCGYYDQAHFIHEFRQFSGRTPGTDGRFFQSSAPAAVVSSGA